MLKTRNDQCSSRPGIEHPRSLMMMGLIAALMMTGIALGLAPAHPAGPGSSSERAPDKADDIVDVLDAIIEAIEEDADDSALQSSCDDDSSDDDSSDEELELDTVKFFIEFNETDEDIGVQSKIDGEPMKKVKLFDPRGKRLMTLRPKRSLRTQGISELFFESDEPTLDDVSVNEFLERFPEGTYEFETRTTEGEEQEGEACFTHDIPAGAVITSPEDGDEVDPDHVVITWEPVTMTTSFAPPVRPVNIIGYQVIVTRDEDPSRTYSVDVAAHVTSVSVAPEFFEPETEYELEIIAIEESDNQTISLIFFETP